MLNLSENLSGRIYDYLIEHCGASPYQRDDFIQSFSHNECVPREWRFCGHYGLAGKFWWNNDKFYVSGWSQVEVSPEEYEEQNLHLVDVNKAMMEFYKEHEG